VLSSPARPPCFGTLDQAAVAHLSADLLGALSPTGVLVPGEDGALGASERRVGRALLALLAGSGMGEVATRLGQRWSAARAAGAPLDLLLDLRSQELRNLPWELLELLPEGEALGGCRVVRLIGGTQAGIAPGPGIEVLIWSPTEADPTCAAVRSALERTLDGLPQIRRVEGGSPPEGFRVVHVICHGGQRGEPVLELGSARSLDAATLGRVLQPLVRGAALVVLDVCGTDGEPELAALPAWRMVDAGAAACLAPRAALDAEASVALSSSLYGALAGGEALLAAVQASRRAMAALGLPDPSARWWTLRLVTADPSVLSLQPGQAPVREPPDLHRAAPNAAAVLSRAAELATAQGFLGLEQLALALARMPDLPALLALIQPQLATFGARTAGFQPTGLSELRVTPRLQALLTGLADGFDLLALVRAMAASRPVRLDLPRLGGFVRELGPMSETLGGESTAPGRAAGRRPVGAGIELEVLGGPDDGLVCVLAEERPLLGRWDPQGDQPDVSVLFAGSGATDLAVSRRHLRWVRGAEVEALAPASLRRDGVIWPMGASVALRPGDLIELGQATRLEVLGVPA